MRILKDEEIQTLVAEEKQLPKNWQSHFKLKEKRGSQHEEGSMKISGEGGNKFKVILRRNRINIFDFSIILMFQDREGKDYHLVRYNGKHSSQHTNKWEKNQGFPNYTFGPAFHIHRATERYQEAGYRIDGFAEVTTAYYDFYSARERFLKDNNILKPESTQTEMSFEGGGFV